MDVSLKALPPHAVYHSNLCAPPAEGSHFYCKLSCSLMVSFPTCFFDSLLLTSQSCLSHDWYDSTNALTWPLSETDMELNLAQEGWIAIFACPKQCFPLSKGTSKERFFKGDLDIHW